MDPERVEEKIGGWHIHPLFPFASIPNKWHGGD